MGLKLLKERPKSLLYLLFSAYEADKITMLALNLCDLHCLDVNINTTVEETSNQSQNKLKNSYIIDNINIP
jgi:hypothetical protein